MNALQYLQLGLVVLLVGAILFLLAKAILRKQKHRIFEFSIFVLALLYEGVDTALPGVRKSAPQIMDWAFITLSLLFVADCVIYGKKFIGSQKVFK